MDCDSGVVARKRGRPKVYVTAEQIAERREKRLEYFREYNKKRRTIQQVPKVIESPKVCVVEDPMVTLRKRNVEQQRNEYWNRMNELIDKECMNELPEIDERVTLDSDDESESSDEAYEEMTVSDSDDESESSDEVYEEMTVSDSDDEREFTIADTDDEREYDLIHERKERKKACKDLCAYEGEL